MKRLILFITLSINAVQGNAQTTSSDSNDTLCFTLDQANYLLKSTEKYVILDSILQVTNDKIQNLQKANKVQGKQLEVAEKVIIAERNEIERLQRKNKFLSIGLGASIVGVLVLVFL
jgi:hypothetical protein